MPISYQEQANFTCPNCGADFAATIWLILDATEEPTAVDALLNGSLNLVTCIQCGNSGPAHAPLLFHDAQRRRVIFAAAPGAAEHEVRDRARDLHALLVGSIPAEARRPYLTDVDIAQDVAGMGHLLQRMERRQRAYARSTPPEEATRPADAGDPPLLLAVQALLEANSPEDIDRVLVEHPLLRAGATDRTLAQLADVAVEQRAYAIAEGLQRARTLLNHLLAAVEPEAPANPLPAALTQALMQAENNTALLALVQAYPILLQPEGDLLLITQIEDALDSGNDRLATALEERRDALGELRKGDVDRSTTTSTLEEAIEALLIADGETAIAEVLDHYPVLLEDVAAQALWQLASEARLGGDEELAQYAIECREMLRRVREGLQP